MDLLTDLLTACILAYFLKRATTVIHAIQGYSLLKFRSRRLCNGCAILCGTFLISALAIFLWLGPQKDLLDLAAMAIAAILLFQHIFPRVHLREHGIEMGTAFVPWNNISKYSWNAAACPNYSSLIMEGPWLMKKQVTVPDERKDVAHGVISGAARLEPATQERFIILTIARFFGWSCFVLLVCYLQQIL